MPNNKLLEHLNPKQQEAVEHIAGPLLIIAGAGSGKTRVITYRLVYLLANNVPGWNILAVTFTNKAAEEMRVRVDKLLREIFPGTYTAPPLLSTFHSFCVRVLRQDIEQIGFKRGFVIYDENDSLSLIKQCLRELNLDEKKTRPKEALYIIDKAKDDLLDAESYQIYAHTSHNDVRQIAAEIYRRYQKKLKDNNALDFGDLIMLTVHLWRSCPEVLQRYQERFRYVLVDEYQDTNHAQYILTKMLTQKFQNICVVGDEDQSIYMFRGADIRNILDFEKDNKNCKVIKLEQNYRSTRHILETAQKVISHNKDRKSKELWTANKKGDPVDFYEVVNEIEEASFVAGSIRRLVKEDVRPLEIAVFYRTNAQSRVMEDALRREQLPYMVIGGMRFYERREVKDILAYLRVLVNPQDSVHLKRIINVPNRGIGKTSLEMIEKYAAEQEIGLPEALQQLDLIAGLQDRAKKNLRGFRQQLQNWSAARINLSTSELAAKIIEESHYIKELEADPQEASERIANVKELISAIKEFEEQSKDKSLETYLEQVALISDLDSWQQEKNYVTLMTLHLAKGLEFNYVFMTGLEEGLLPHANSLATQIEREEERRLCYVGMTRAKRRLVITSAAERRVNGVRRWNIPSRFIAEAELIEREIEKPFVENTEMTPEARHQIPESGFKKNQRIGHEVFGAGRIIEVSGSGEDQKIIVDFNSGVRKKLLVKAANLKVL
ncbi:MAG: UvrD-helicase domain-containing protein [Elusimicrobia bacterium]|nr:UvrD-helicase domain-containing protein [Elusimicrobiota bacterium]